MSKPYTAPNPPIDPAGQIGDRSREHAELRLACIRKAWATRLTGEGLATLLHRARWIARFVLNGEMPVVRPQPPEPTPGPSPEPVAEPLRTLREVVRDEIRAQEMHDRHVLRELVREELVRRARSEQERPPPTEADNDSITISTSRLYAGDPRLAEILIQLGQAMQRVAPADGEGGPT